MANQVILYTRQGCELCDIVERVLRDVSRRRKFELALRDIDDDAADFEKYKHDIPVVTVNGREVARWKLTASEFEAALDQWGEKS